MYEIIYDYDDGNSESRNNVEEFEGSWTELQAHIKEMRKQGCFNITATGTKEKAQVHDEDDPPVEPLGDILTAAIVQCGEGGNVPYISPVDCCARLYASEVVENADNAEVIREQGVNHLVIEVFPDHWHVSQVGGYSPDGGLYTKLY